MCSSPSFVEGATVALAAWSALAVVLCTFHILELQVGGPVSGFSDELQPEGVALLGALAFVSAITVSTPRRHLCTILLNRQN